MVFARVAEYLSGSSTDQAAVHNERPAAEAAQSIATRRQEEVMDAEIVDIDLDAARPPYLHVRPQASDLSSFF